MLTRKPFGVPNQLWHHAHVFNARKKISNFTKLYICTNLFQCCLASVLDLSCLQHPGI